MQDALNSLTNWCHKNKMVINAKKSSCMLICNRQKRIFLQNSNLNLNVCNESLSCVRNMKTLAIIIDDALSWRDQVNEVSLKLSRQIACLRQIKSYLHIKSRLLFYNSYFLPAMNYCNVVRGRCGKGLTDRIFKLHKRILRMVYDDYVSNVDFLLKRAGTLSVYQRIDYDTVILVFKEAKSHLFIFYIIPVSFKRTI